MQECLQNPKLWFGHLERMEGRFWPSICQKLEVGGSLAKYLTLNSGISYISKTASRSVCCIPLVVERFHRLKRIINRDSFSVCCCVSVWEGSFHLCIFCIWTLVDISGCRCLGSNYISNDYSVGSQWCSYQARVEILTAVFLALSTSIGASWLIMGAFVLPVLSFKPLSSGFDF